MNFRHNSRWLALALSFLLVGAGQQPGQSKTTGEPMSSGLKKAAFAAGCFWGVEKIFAHIDGVVETQVGYAGGQTENPDYHGVCTGRTGHAEAVEIVYDPQKVSYEELLITFWEWHDPTTPNQQGPDIGSQYRSVIFYYDEQQKNQATRSKQLLESARLFVRPISTEIVPAGPFYTAEEYHQDYLEKNPGGYCSHFLRSPKIRQILTGKTNS
jgi:peptide-methionine (S)-S-oxide reductase